MPAGSTVTAEAIDRIVDRIADPFASEEQRQESFREAARLLPFDEQGEGRRLYDDELMASRIAVASPRTIDTADALLESSESAEVRWMAFVIGSIAARRFRQMTKAQEFRDLGERDFGDRGITLHFRGLSYLNEATEGLRKGYHLERQALEGFPRHVGVLHATAYFIVELAECGVPEIRKPELQEGIRFVEDAMSRPRARFYYTRGRLYRHLGEFDAARQDLRRAIDLEDRSAKDYLERFVDYSIQLSSIAVAQDAQTARESLEREIAAQLDAAEVQVGEQTRKAIDRVDRAEIRLVEVVAFIIAAVGLVQFTLGAVAKRSFLEALGLEIAFGIIMFGAVYFLSWLLRRPREA